jgi:hypothetical protein
LSYHAEGELTFKVVKGEVLVSRNVTNLRIDPPITLAEGDTLTINYTFSECMPDIKRGILRLCKAQRSHKKVLK